MTGCTCASCTSTHDRLDDPRFGRGGKLGERLSANSLAALSSVSGRSVQELLETARIKF